MLTTKFLSYCLYLVLLAFENNSQSVVIQDFSTIIDGNLRNLLLLDNNILVGSTRNLFRLDAENLNIKTTLNLTGANRLLLLLKPLPGIDGDVLACQETDCSLFDSNLETVINVSIDNDAEQAESVVPGLDDLVSIAGTDQTFFLAKDHYNTANNIESILSKFSYAENSSDNLQLSVVAKQIEGHIFIQRTFLTSFEYDTFVYIVYDLITGNSMDSRLRVVRFCANETGSSTVTFTTYTETKLNCNGVNKFSDSQITSAATATVGSELKLLVAYHSASTNYICSYNITDINQAMDDKLDECKQEIGLINLVRAGQSECPTDLTDFQRNLNTPCFRIGQFRLPLESDGFVQGSIILSSLATQPFSSLESMNYEDIVYVIGGLNGGIEQFYYAGNSLSYIRSINLTMTNDAIQEIHVSNNSDFYYFLSNKSVAKYPVNVCEQYSSCQTCVESIDPLCGGWCTLYSSCTKLSDCTSSPQIWATSNTQCPTINSIDPSFVDASQLDDMNTVFTINYESIPNITYDCVYQFDDMITVSSVPAQVATNNTIVCPLPSINIFPEFGARSTLSAYLSLRAMEDIDIISQQVNFTNSENSVSTPIQTESIIVFVSPTSSSTTTSSVPISTPIQTESIIVFVSPISSSTTTSSVPISTPIQTESSNVVSVGIGGTIGAIVLLTIIIIIVVGVLLYYNKRRKSILITQLLKVQSVNLNDKDIEQVEMTDYVDVDAEIQKELEDRVSNSLIDKTRLKLIEKLGEGEYGVVFRGILDGDITPVAVKTLKGPFNQSNVDGIIKEALIMKPFNHINVLPLIGVCLNLKDAPCIVMPFMNEGSLLSYLKREKPNLTISILANDNLVSETAKKLLSMCLQVANGMGYLAKQKFVHRDLAARNCMISSDGIIKVADFGLSEDIYETEYFRQHSNNIKLPIKWMALESIYYKKFTEKTDVWSYGVLCWEVFTCGMPPYPNMIPKEVISALNEGKRLEKPTNAVCSEKMYSLMFSCWNESVEGRPTFDQIIDTLEHLIAPLAQYMDFTELYVIMK